jgi:hypothetical protein
MLDRKIKNVAWSRTAYLIKDIKWCAISVGAQRLELKCSCNQ